MGLPIRLCSVSNFCRNGRNDLQSKFPYLVQMRKNTDQKNSEYGQFSHRVDSRDLQAVDALFLAVYHLAHYWSTLQFYTPRKIFGSLMVSGSIKWKYCGQKWVNMKLHLRKFPSFNFFMNLLNIL